MDQDNNHNSKSVKRKKVIKVKLKRRPRDLKTELDWAEEQLNTANMLIATSEEKFESTLKNVVKITNLLTSSLLLLDKISTSKKDSCETNAMKNLILPSHKHGPQARHRVVPMVRGLPISTKPKILLSRVVLPSQGNSRNDPSSTVNIRPVLPGTTQRLPSPLSAAENNVYTSSTSDSAEPRTENIASEEPNPTENVAIDPHTITVSSLHADSNVPAGSAINVANEVLLPPRNESSDLVNINEDTTETLPANESLVLDQPCSNEPTTNENIVASEPIANENTPSSEQIFTENISTSENVLPCEAICTRNIASNEQFSAVNTSQSEPIENISAYEPIATKNVSPCEPMVIDNIASEIVPNENIALCESIATENTVSSESIASENTVSSKSIDTENNTSRESISNENFISSETVVTENTPLHVQIATENSVLRESMVMDNISLSESISTENITLNETLTSEIRPAALCEPIASELPAACEPIATENITASQSKSVENIASNESSSMKNIDTCTLSINAINEPQTVENVAPIEQPFQIITLNEPLSSNALISDAQNITENPASDPAMNVQSTMPALFQATNSSCPPTENQNIILHPSSCSDDNNPQQSFDTENREAKLTPAVSSQMSQTKCSVKPWTPEPKRDIFQSSCGKKLEMMKENMNTTLKYLAEITSDLMNGKEEIKSYFANLSKNANFQSTLSEASPEDNVDRETYNTEVSLPCSQSQGFQNITTTSRLFGPTVKLTKLNIKVTAENSSQLQSGPTTSKMDQSFSFKDNIPSTATSGIFGATVKLTKLNIKVTAENSEEPRSQMTTSNMDKTIELKNASARKKVSTGILSSTVKLNKLNPKRSADNSITAGSSVVTCEVDQIIGSSTDSPKCKIRRKTRDPEQRLSDQTAGCSSPVETKTKRKDTIGRTKRAAKKVGNIASNCVVRLRRENF